MKNEETKWMPVEYGLGLSKLFDTKEEALEYGRILIKRNDEMTGYEKVFGHPSEEPVVVEVATHEVSTTEYLETLKRIKKLKDRYDRLFRNSVEKYYRVTRAYRNQVPYDLFDEIEMVVKMPNGRKKVYVAVVCDVIIMKNGERRPQLRGMSYPMDAEILSIRVIRKEPQVELRWGGVSKAREEGV